MNVLSETTNRARLLDRAEQNLTNARSDGAGAKAASLITSVDVPDTGTSPVSPSGFVILLGGLLGGLLAGVGVVLLTAPAPAAPITAPQSSSPAADLATASASDTFLVPCAAAPQRAIPAATLHEPWSMTVTAHGSLNCTQALKVLNEQGKLKNATFA